MDTATGSMMSDRRSVIAERGVRRGLTLRWRMVILSALVVTAILVVGGLLLSVGLRGVLVRNAVAAAGLRADDLAALAAAGSLPGTISVTGEEGALAQVVIDGRVVAASDNVEGEAPVVAAELGDGQRQVRTVRNLPIGEGGRFEVVSVGATTADGPAVVHVAISLDEIEETVAAAARIGLVGLPILVLALSGAMWVVVGRTLRPIEEIRREADDIGGHELGRRVPEPSVMDEVGRLSATVNRMLERIETAAHQQRRFVGDAAHELRSPIASLRTQLETARASRRGVDWDDVSADLLAETLRMQRLTDQLLLLARLDATALDAHRTALDLDDLIAEVVTPIRRAWSGGTVDLAAVRPVQIHAEPTLIEQVVRNLVENAVRHARERVTISLVTDGPAARLRVDDDGPGVPTESRAAVFDRFARLDDARSRRDGGAGLGLSIVADIVTMHGGEVALQDGPAGTGTRVEVRLPIG